MTLKDKKIIESFKKITGIKNQTKFILDTVPKDLAGKFKLEKPRTYYSCTTDPCTYSYFDMPYVELPTGSYELADIEKKVNDLLTPILKDFKFTIQLDKVTLKCTLHCTHQLFGSDENSIAKALGFDRAQILQPLTHTIANSTVNIMSVNVIKIDCNIISGSYSNGIPVHTLHEFYPTVAIGYKIVEVPHNVIYLPITARSISNVHVRVVDQDGYLVDFRGETVTLRIHIKKL